MHGLAGLSERFSKLAATFDQSELLGSERDREQAMRVIKPGPRETGLDLACGPGHLGVSLAEAGGRVLAVDISEEMLKLCAHRSSEAGQKNLTIALQDAHQMEFRDGMFNWVCCRFGFRWFLDPLKVLAELFRITRHGGRVYLSEWVPDLPGIDPLPLEFLLRELDPAQQELAGRALWERRAQDAGFQRGHDLVRPDRLDPIAIGALGGLPEDEARECFARWRVGPGSAPQCRYLVLDGRECLLAQRMDLLLIKP
ncbi:MAG: methyltransferase domain-containing protein [Candidatus Delongbacteria bacterium]|nr:methyltransferase domain-containing protein [Candidatus Delongbacteria bacterium]